MISKLFKSVFFISILPLVTFSQIQITSSSLLSLNGKNYNAEVDTSLSVMVNVGSSGANQSWNFNNINIENPLFTLRQYTVPDDTPFAENFPNSNMVEKVTSPDSEGIELYSYYNVQSSSLYNLGFGTYFASQPGFSNITYNDDVAPLPLQFGTNWISISEDTSGFFPTSATITTDSTVNIVDAWGTVTIPAGSYQCLRIKAESKTITKTYAFGIEINSDTSQSFSYSWITNEAFIVVSAESQEGETDPNFTNAAGFSRLTNEVVGVTEEKELVPQKYSLSQNYPNPFNPTTLISFNLPEASEVSLKIYDVTGKEVKNLINKYMNAGNHSMKWNGRNDSGELLSSGVYLYRIKAGNFMETKKALLLK